MQIRHFECQHDEGETTNIKSISFVIARKLVNQSVECRVEIIYYRRYFDDAVRRFVEKTSIRRIRRRTFFEAVDVKIYLFDRGTVER